MEKSDVDIDGYLKGLIPASNYRPQIIGWSIDSLQDEERQYRLNHFKDETFLFQFRIPPFQRPIVWTDSQCIAFIESVWKCYNLGSYTVNKLEWVGRGDNARPHPYDGWLLDGLQRLTAIKRYYNNEFKVLGYFWNELTKPDYLRFKQVSFPEARVSITDLQELKNLYNALNYGGTPHTEEQRAI